MSLTPKTIGQLNAIDQITSGTFFLVEKDGITFKAPYSEIAVSNYTSVLYADLYTAHSGGALIPGMFYLITDYETCYDRPNYDSYGNPITTGNYIASGVIEPLLVLATSTNTLAAEAHSLTYPKHKIKYDIMFGLTEVTGSPAKGRITERIDEKNNRADYDFMNVEFVRYDGYFCETIHPGTISIDYLGNVTGTDTLFTNDFSVGDIFAVYGSSAPIASFTFYEIESITDNNIMKVIGVNYSVETNVKYSRGISLGTKCPFPSNVPSTTSNQILYKTFNNDLNFNTYIGDNLSYDAFILSNNVFLSGSYRNNAFGGNSIGNTFDDDMDSNTIGSYFQFNIMTNDFDRNTIGSYMQRNIIDCDMDSNRIGNYFQHNMIGDDDGADFDFNLIGEWFEANFITMSNGSFMENTIGRRFYANFIKDTFQDNIIVGSFTTNMIMNVFEMNTIGNNFDTNIIENNFTMNTIGADFYYNTIKNGTFRSNSTLNNFNNNNIDGNFMYNTIGTDFYYNTIQTGFGVIMGEGFYPMGNKIGNGFHNNTVGTNFFNNVIADNFSNTHVYNGFRDNKVEVNGIYDDFRTKVNSVASVSINIPESTYIDGVYNVYQTGYNPSSSDNQGTGAQFAITVSGGLITNISVVAGGYLYGTYDMIMISMDQIPGSTQDLGLIVNTLTQIPLIYQPINSTISRGFDPVNGDALMVSSVYNGGFYTSNDYKGPMVIDNGGGGNTGSGSWYFYTTEGALTVGPPTSDGQAIFTDNLLEGGTNSTFNPNNNTGLDYLNFCLKDSTGTDYTTQFTALQNNGGTVSITQNGNTATYTFGAGVVFVQSPPGFAVINTNVATQTVIANSPFVYGDPISITFS